MDIDDIENNKQRIQVVCRVRPMNSKEKTEYGIHSHQSNAWKLIIASLIGGKECLTVDNESNSIILNGKPDSKTFTYDKVYDTNATQVCHTSIELFSVGRFVSGNWKADLHRCLEWLQWLNLRLRSDWFRKDIHNSRYADTCSQWWLEIHDIFIRWLPRWRKQARIVAPYSRVHLCLH